LPCGLKQGHQQVSLNGQMVRLGWHPAHTVSSFRALNVARLAPSRAVICGLEAELRRPVYRWPVTLLMRLQQVLLHPHPMESNPAWAQTGVTMLPRIRTSSRPRSILASCDIRAAPTCVQRFAGSAERRTIPRADL
jgi:hypothetical protein